MRISLVAIVVKDTVQIVKPQPLKVTHPARVNVVRSFRIVDIPVTPSVTVDLLVLPANKTVKNLVYMDLARMSAVIPVILAYDHTREIVVIRLSRLCCAHCHLKSFRALNCVIKVSLPLQF